ncbi:AAA family ATPase [Flindersiella endophytica]
MTAPYTAGVPRSMAVVSGKGGSGKTLITVGLAMLIGEEIGRYHQQVILMDGDPITAGLSYYLGLKQAHGKGDGFSDFALAIEQHRQVSVRSLLRPVGGGVDQENAQCLLLPVGAHSRLLRDVDQKRYPHLLGILVDRLKETGEWVIVDCRGGIDDESLAICEQVDEILLVVEPDVTSLQSSQHLVEVLHSHDLADKLVGFIVNKAFEDPSVLRQSATGLFQTECLAAVPFDFDTARATLVGDLPSKDSPFIANLRPVAAELVPDAHAVNGSAPPEWNLVDSAMRSPERARGGVVLNFLLLAIGAAVTVRAATQGDSDPVLISSIFGLTLLGVLAGSASLRQALGHWIRRPAGRGRKGQR